MRITGLMINYYFVCKRRLWYLIHEINLENENEDVMIGKEIDENTYRSNDKHITINDEISIDFIKNNIICETKKSKILIDIGITYQHLASELSNLDRTPKDLDAILITHTHSDHIKGLQGLIRKTNLPVYVSEKMMTELQEKIPVTVCRYLEEHFFLNQYFHHNL